MNSSNKTLYALDSWFGLYGFPYTADIIFAYVTTPVWLLSLLLSIFSLFILNKKPFFASSFFSYMRLYAANCAILSALSLTTIFSFTRRFFGSANTYAASLYGIYALCFIGNSLILFSSSIEICLVVERILYLLPVGYTRIKRIGFSKFFFILFIVCVLVNVPCVFLFEAAFVDIQLNRGIKFTLWYFGPTTLSNGRTGQILNYFGYLFRDILPMALKIILNSLSVRLVGKFVNIKRRISAPSTDLESFDRRQTYIAHAMNIFSLVEHMLNVVVYVLYFFNRYNMSTLVFAVAFLSIALKHSLIFFILLVFNNLFRNEVKSYFKWL